MAYVESQPYEHTYELIAVDNIVKESESAYGLVIAFQYTKNEFLYYRFYIKDEYGGIKLKEILCTDITIYEDLKEDESPYYIESSNYELGYKQFHITPNSIIRNINVDVINEEGNN